MVNIKDITFIMAKDCCNKRQLQDADWRFEVAFYFGGTDYRLEDTEANCIGFGEGAIVCSNHKAIVNYINKNYLYLP